MQGLEIIALRKYKDIVDFFPQFTENKLTEAEQRQKAFRSKFKKQHEFFYFMILTISRSVQDYKMLLEMTPVEIVDYYLSTQLE